MNWNVEVDREWMKNLFVRVGYQQRENRFESVIDQVAVGGGTTVTAHRTDGGSRYREGFVLGKP